MKARSSRCSACRGRFAMGASKFVALVDVDRSDRDAGGSGIQAERIVAHDAKAP